MNLSSMFFTATVDKGRLTWDEPAQVSVALAKFKPGERIRVSLSRVSAPRTLDQNSRMWALLRCFKVWGWDAEDAKIWACSQFLPPVVREFPDGTRRETPAYHTSDLNTAGMAEFQERIERWLNEQGVYFGEHA